MNRKPRFFCDNCGKEVGQNEKACRHCGRFFASVRCPNCGYTGDETSFKNGCPACGYSASPNKQAENKSEKHHMIPAGKLPLWVYILSIGAFIAACVALFAKLK